MAINASKDVSPSERIAAAYKRLAESATYLNTASDELGKSILALEAALRGLNLGVTTWVQFAGSENSDGDFTDHCVGYAKVGGKWGIALSVAKGNRSWPEDSRDDEWLFNDAPRALRADAVDALPELVESLVTTAETTAKKIKEKTGRARELAATINALETAAPPRSRRA